MYLFKLLNIFVQISKSFQVPKYICSNCNRTSLRASKLTSKQPAYLRCCDARTPCNILYSPCLEGITCNDMFAMLILGQIFLYICNVIFATVIFVKDAFVKGFLPYNLAYLRGPPAIS